MTADLSYIREHKEPTDRSEGGQKTPNDPSVVWGKDIPDNNADNYRRTGQHTKFPRTELLQISLRPSPGLLVATSIPTADPVFFSKGA